MAGQSMLMGDAFGKSYQYGKRKISAMSNEEFNQLTPEDLAKDITADFNALIPELKIAMAASTEFQGQIIRELGAMLQNFINDLPDNVKQFILGLGSGSGFENPDINPTPTPTQGSIYDWLNKLKDTVIGGTTFIPKLLSSQGILTSATNYITLLGHINNLLAGVSIMNKRIIDDAAQLLKELIIKDNADNLPDESDPTLEPRTEIITEPTTEQEQTVLTPTFVGLLTQSDLEIGGQRSRMTSQGLIQWTGTHRISYSGGIVRISLWQNGWVAQKQVAALTQSEAIQIINEIKSLQGSSYVLEFKSTTLFFLVSDGHVTGFK